jgi:HEAT repeat protein
MTLSHRACRYALLGLVLLSGPLHLSAAEPAQNPPSDRERLLHGKTASQIEAMLADDDPAKRREAILMLKDTGSAAIPVYIWAFSNDEDPGVKLAAIKALIPLGAATEPAAIPLVDLLAIEPLPSIQKQIIYVLGVMGPYATEAVPILKRLQKEASLPVRVNASQALDHILNSVPKD